MEGVLEVLVRCVAEGGVQQKELGLYLLAGLGKDVELLYGEEFYQVNEKLVTFLTSTVSQLLNLSPTITAA